MNIIIIATDHSNVNERIMIDTNHVCLEQKQLYFVSKPFMILICNSYSTFMILSLCYQGKLIMSSLSKDKDDNNGDDAFTHNKMIQNNTHITELTQILQVDIFSSSSYLLDQYNKTSLLFISPLSLYAVSSNKLKCYRKQFWLHQISIGVLSIVISTPKTHAQSFQPDQIYTPSDLAGYISNCNLFDINKTKEKNKELQSNNSQTHIASSFLLLGQNHMPMNCCAEYFVTMWNISTVSLQHMHT